MTINRTASERTAPLGGADALFGRDLTERIVAVETEGESGLRIYRREADGVRSERVPFQPWILFTERPALNLPGAQFRTLEGEGYSVLAEFPTQSAYTEARFLVRDAHLSHLTYAGGAKMALLQSGKTLFKGMTFEEIVRLQFDIETAGLDPMEERNRILMIAVADNRGLLELIEGDEPEMLARFAEIIRERDPDVLEGHNVFGFDLPYLMKRAQRHGVRLALGRDGSEPRFGGERNYAIAAGGNSRPFSPVYLYGRHVLDTYLIVQRFDWAKQALTSYGLKECARVFGFAESDRVELPRDRMEEIYRDDPELVRTYARQDVLETGKLAELVTPVEFYQTQMVPDNYGQVAVTGNGEKINAIFLRACLAAGVAVPRAQSARPYAGGYTEVRAVGVLHQVVKADVESLYPSLMLTHQIAPESDRLGVFLPCLKELTARRIEAKRKAAEATNADERLYWDGLQGSFKVLINSFYGYLGGPFSLNDYAAAEKITELGRELVQDIARRMDETGSTVIEIDTDGVYFVPPSGVAGEDAEQRYVAEIGAALPEGIRLAFDGRFQTMLSVKTKNYVLVTYEGRKIYKGASLRSRADERYGRRFLAQMIDCLLQGDLAGIAQRYEELIEELLHRRVPIEDLARRERITENTFQSAQKERMAKIAQGVAVGEFLMVYEKANGELGRLEDYANDENARYYMEKLYKFARRLEEAVNGIEPGAFDRTLPKPTPQGLPHKIQPTLDLFD